MFQAHSCGGRAAKEQLTADRQHVGQPNVTLVKQILESRLDMRVPLRSGMSMEGS